MTTGIKDLIDLRSTEELSEDKYYNPHNGTFSAVRPISNSLAAGARMPAPSPTPMASFNGVQPSPPPDVTSAASQIGGAASTSGSSRGLQGCVGGDKAATGSVRTLFGGTQFRRYLRQWLSWQVGIDGA